MEKLVVAKTGNNPVVTYTYDDNGNIRTISDGTYTTRYSYDGANQLIREDNERAGKSWYWNYYSNGNVRTAHEFDYTLGAPPTNTPVTFTYGDDKWGDLLTKHGSTAFTYDEIGNTLTDGTWTYTWERGRQLKSMSKSGTTWNMTYDADGLRTSRIATDSEGNTGSKYYYYYEGGLLTYMKFNSLVMRFTYDAQGNPVSMTYNGNIYFYVLNLQGDVMALLDSSGNEVVSYHYNAWGKIISTTASTTGMLNSLAKYNPLRYRGYVYDRETGLYYLQSRYYNPEICRFISADNQLSTDSPIDVNLFAYCGNNPVNRVDPTGEAWWHWALGAAVVAACAVATVVTCGGFAAAATAVGLVSSGIAASTTAATVATAAFIGSATVYGTAVIAAAAASNSIQDFYDKGNWGTVVATVLGAGIDGFNGYQMYTQQSYQWDNSYNFDGAKSEKYARKRGWDDRTIRYAIHNGRQGISKNLRNGEQCTVYGYPGTSNQYVVIENSTRNVVQFSKLSDPNWVVDGNIVWAP